MKESCGLELDPAVEDAARSLPGVAEADAFPTRLEQLSFDIFEPLSQVYGGVAGHRGVRRSGGQRRLSLAYFHAWARVLRIVDGPDAVHRRSVAREEAKRVSPVHGRYRR
jgi:hypothetical protein